MDRVSGPQAYFTYHEMESSDDHENMIPLLACDLFSYFILFSTVSCDMRWDCGFPWVLFKFCSNTQSHCQYIPLALCSALVATLRSYNPHTNYCGFPCIPFTCSYNYIVNTFREYCEAHWHAHRRTSKLQHIHQRFYSLLLQHNTQRKDLLSFFSSGPFTMC